MTYKDPDRQREANRERQRRFRAKARGIEQIVDKEGVIYLIQCVGFPYYKIGISDNTENRLSTLQTGVPFELKLIKSVYVTKAIEAERYLHSLYEAKRVRGEWFNFTDNELDDVIGKYEHLSLFYRMIG